MEHQRLELSDADAKPLVKLGIDAQVTLSISGKIREIGKHHKMEELPMEAGTSEKPNKKKPKEVPYVIIDIMTVTGRKGKPVEELSEDELEEDIMEAKRGEAEDEKEED